MTQGRFIVFEGGEGCGKTTQSRRLAERLDALWTRQPGGTEMGAELRRVLLDGRPGDVCDRAEALLMAADRAQHVRELIVPTLTSGRDVVCDRYVGSSVAYQGWGRGLDPDAIRRLSEWAVDGLSPDLVVLLDVSLAHATDRMGSTRDRIESAGDEFHARVRAGFVAQAAADPGVWVTIDGSGSVDEVAASVTAAVESRWRVERDGT